MKKHLKKTTAVLLALLIVTTTISALPFTVSAKEITVDSVGAASGTTGTCTWILNDEGTLSISGNGDMEDYNSSNYAPWKGNKVNNVIIEHGVKNIGNWAFAYCGNLTSVTIPDSVTRIGAYSFTWCNLNSVTIPDSVASIGHFAFSHCKMISVNIPSSVTSIGTGIFNSCGDLTNITVDSNNTEFYSNNGNLFNKKCTTLLQYAPGKTNSYFSIPDSVNYIYNYAFHECINLTFVSIPDSVKTIGYDAFSDCNGLTSVAIPDSVEDIGYSAFKNCRNLTYVYVLNPNTNIGASAFGYYNNDGIQKVDGFTIVGYYKDSNAAAYAKDNGFTFLIDHGKTGECQWKINEEGTLIISGNGAMENYNYPTRNLWRKYKFSEVIIEDGVTSIGTYSFEDCKNLTSIIIPESVTSIGCFAFYNCESLTDITIPDSVTSIGEGAFVNCTSLASINIPNNVTTIEYCTFSCCSSLISITIPDSVTFIDEWAFDRCTNLKDITIPDSVVIIGSGAFERTKWYDNQPDGIVYVGKVVYDYKGTIPENTSLSLEEGTVGIAKEAFYDCSGLRSIVIPNSVTSVGDYAFCDCENLETVNLPDSLANIGYKAFENTKWYNEQSDGIVYAGKVAYSYKGTMPENTILTLDEETVGIATGAFSNCVLLSGSKNNTDNKPEEIESVGAGEPNGFENLKGIIIPESVEIIGAGAFLNCENLESITISGSVSNIGSYAFLNCYSLKSVNIPSSVKSIGIKAFGYSTDSKIKSKENTESYENIFEELKDYEFSKIEGFSIMGKHDSEAYVYAIKNGFDNNFIPIEYKFLWGKDNWSFNNIYDSFKDAYEDNSIINDDIIDNLAGKFKIESEEMKNNVYQPYDKNSPTWKGNCFGMTVAEILVKQGLLTKEDFSDQTECDYLYNYSSKDGNILTVISFLQALLSVGKYNQMNKSDAGTGDNSSQDSNKPTQEEFLKKIESELIHNDSVILIEYECFDNKSWLENKMSKHAVLGYGIESGSYEYNDKTYEHRILIADPNHLAPKIENGESCLFDDACIYYNSSDGSWICPYKNNDNELCYYKGESDYKGKIKNIIKYHSLTNPEFYPEVPKEYIAGLTVFNSKGNQTVGEGIKEYIISDQLNDRKYYALDNTQDCSFSYNEPSDYSMMMDYENISYYANVENGTSTLVKPEGYINIEGFNATYSITMMTDNSKDKSDWYSITVSGNNANNVTLTKREDGYLIKTDSSEDSLGYITITAKNNSGRISVAYNTQSSSAIIKKDENNIAVMVNSNEDGDYDKKLSPMGDVNGNGVVDINDVTAIQYHLAELEPLKDNQLAFADVDGNGAFDINDATKLQKYLAGLTG